MRDRSKIITRSQEVRRQELRELGSRQQVCGNLLWRIVRKINPVEFRLPFSSNAVSQSRPAESLTCGAPLPEASNAHMVGLVGY
jgi:hypothetical protein